MIAPSHSHMTIGETMSRKVAFHGWVTNRSAMPRMAMSRAW